MMTPGFLKPKPQPTADYLVGRVVRMNGKAYRISKDSFDPINEPPPPYQPKSEQERRKLEM